MEHIEGIAFIIKTEKIGFSGRVFEIAINPTSENIYKMQHICEARGADKWILVYLTGDQLGRFKSFFKVR